MKKTLLLVLPLLLALASCTKTVVVPGGQIDESYWLSKQRGVITDSDPLCDYFVVETPYGYSVLRNWGSYTPRIGAVIYGNLDRYGVFNFYNRSEGYIMEADVREYWLSAFDAMDYMQAKCGSPY